jgi:hypothetical protein
VRVVLAPIASLAPHAPITLNPDDPHSRPMHTGKGETVYSCQIGDHLRHFGALLTHQRAAKIVLFGEAKRRKGHVGPPLSRT